MEPGNKIKVPHRRDRRKKSPGVLAVKFAAKFTEFEVRTVSFGPRFFPLIYGPYTSEVNRARRKGFQI